jgi:glycosyltransferase involved in cell wall biosynthesis
VRVLHVVAYFPPDRTGGVGQVVYHLHRGLRATGHHSVVLTAGRTESDPHVVRVADSPLRFITSLPRYARMTRDFDVVHCQAGDAFLLLLAMRLLRIRTPVLSTFHVSQRGLRNASRTYRIEGRTFGRELANWRHRNVTSRLNALADGAMLRLANRVVFISGSTAIDTQGPRGGIAAHVIYNGIPELPACNNDGTAVEKIELLFVGLAAHRKRVLALPYVLRRVRERVPSARLRLVGFDLVDQPQLVALFREQRVLDAVVCEGTLRSEDVVPFYRAADVLLVPSAYEGLPMVILEAFQCGLPCVATRVSGHREIIEDGVNGFLVDIDHPDQMAECCVEILQHPGHRQSMGRAGQEVVRRRFSLARQVEDYLDTYQRMIDHG